MTKKALAGLELKHKNRNDVYRVIHSQQCVTKQDIATELKLSLPTINQNLDELTEEGLIYVNGSFGNTGGRRARGYSVTEGARMAIGIDLNKSHLSVVVVDLLGEIRFHARRMVEFQWDVAYFGQMSELVEQGVQTVGVSTDRILGVGVCVQGVVDQEGNAVAYGPICGITGKTRSELEAFLPYPVKLFHDAASAAYAEVWNSPELDNAVYLSLSTNLGSSVIINRRIYEGEDGFGGNAEHMTLIPDGKQCYCGQQGCAECYCAAAVLEETVKEQDLAVFFERLHEQSPKHVEAFQNYRKHLSILLNNLRMLYNCELILGGYMGKYLEVYMEEIRQETYQRNGFPHTENYIRQCRCRVEAIAYGGALRFIDAFIQSI